MRVGWRCRLLLSGSALVLAPAVAVLGLMVADWTEVRHRTIDPFAGIVLTIDRGDRLHYVGHFLLGRALDLCACADDLAAEQYDRAAHHARTVRQLALVASGRPGAPMEWVADGAGIVTSGARWGHRGFLWLTARLPRLAGLGRALVATPPADGV